MGFYNRILVYVKWMSISVLKDAIPIRSNVYTRILMIHTLNANTRMTLATTNVVQIWSEMTLNYHVIVER